jgi:hypothetical protein
VEVFPVVAGLVCGGLVGVTAGRWRLWQVVVVAVGLGSAATVLTGEWRISWLFLLVDVPLVAVCAVAGCLAAKAARLGVPRGRAGL